MRVSRLGQVLFNELTKTDQPHGGEYRFVVSPDEAGAYRWRFLTPSGRLVAISGEAYPNVDDCRTAIAVLCREAKSGTLVEIDLSSG